MNYGPLVALVFLGVVFVLSQDASAQVAGNKAFSLVGDGFAASEDSISSTSIDLLFTTVQAKSKIDINLQSGAIILDDSDLDISNFNGLVLRDGKFFRITSDAIGPEGEQFSFRALGRLIDTAKTDSIYSLTATLTDPSKKVTKLVFTTLASEFTPKITEIKKDIVIVKILKGAANPSEQTYIEQSAGFRFDYFSDSRITIPVGGTVTFVNEDVVSHSLKSGTANYVSRHKTFTPDGKISSGEIEPGKSWSVTYDKIGFYRLFDENYQWMDVTIFVTTPTSSQVIGSTIKPTN
jgi:plastocyanin